MDLTKGKKNEGRRWTVSWKCKMEHLTSKKIGRI